MSWDILIQDLPSGAESVGDIPDAFQPAPLGRRADVIAAIRDFAPTADFTDPSWGELVTPEYVIEFNMGDEGLIDSIMLHVRGGGAAAAFVGTLLDRLECRAIDCSTGDFFSLAESEKSFSEWQEFRDHAVQTQDSVPVERPAKRRGFFLKRG